jgi:hypothetical protein
MHHHPPTVRGRGILEERGAAFVGELRRPAQSSATHAICKVPSKATQAAAHIARINRIARSAAALKMKAVAPQKQLSARQGLPGLA